MAVKLSPLFNEATLDSSGNPYTGAQLFTYAAGSTTKQTTYQDSGAQAQHTNPIILNSRGEPPAAIWLTEGLTYKFVLATPTDSDPPAGSVRSIDNITGINDVEAEAADQWISSGLTPTYSSATVFTLSGDQTSTFSVGRRLKFTVSGGTVYGTIYTSAYGALTTVTMAMDSSGDLDSGLSAVSYAQLTSVNPSLPAVAQQTVASATTTKLASARGPVLHVSGTTTITSFGNAPSGMVRTVIFDDALLLTHNGTSLILPGAANITTTAGDVATFVSEGGGNWKCTEYTFTSVAYSVVTWTATLTGCATAPTYTVYTTKHGNVVTHAIADAAGNVSATSNATGKTLTGMAAAYRPARSKSFINGVQDNGGAFVAGQITIGTDGVINIFSTLGGAAFTASGTFSFLGGWSCSYTLA